MHISAIILAAGASSRMGSDKALLKLANGMTLLEDQLRRVQAAGITDVRVVLGHNCETILKACHREESASGGRRGDPQIPPRPPFSKGGIRGNSGGLLRRLRLPAGRRAPRNDTTFITNVNWQAGYFSSIKCGMEGLHHAEVAPATQAGVDTGMILLPLDTVGVPPEVIGQIRDLGIESGKNVIPTYDGKGGHPVFLRPELIRKVLATPLSSRLDHLLQADKETLKLPVNSGNILNNINTPDEWARLRSDIS